MSHQDALEEFKIMLSNLRDFPDKKLILELTRFAEIHIQFAQNISSILIARTVDPSTQITFKLPTFYVIDSVMKHVGGPYPALFSRYLGDAFVRCFYEVPERDQTKMDTLLGTWEERKLMSVDFLTKLRSHVIAANMQKHGAGPVPAMLHPSGVSMKRIREEEMQSEVPLKQPFHPDSGFSQQHPDRGHQSRAMPAFEEVVDTEMEKLLLQMYDDMQVDVDSRLSLQDLSHLNPGLFDQMRAAATESAILIFKSWQTAPMLQQPHPMQEQIESPSPMPVQHAGTAGSRPGTRMPLHEQSISHESIPQGIAEKQTLPILAPLVAAPTLSGLPTSVGKPVSRGEERKPSLVKAFIGGAALTLNANRIHALYSRISESTLPDAICPQAHAISSSKELLADKMKYFLDTLFIPPPLPPTLLGPLPLEPSKEYQAREAARVTAVAKSPTTVTKQAIAVIPRFRASELNRPVILGIRALYGDMPHQYSEDGVRFKSMVDLAKHTDTYLAKKEAIRRKELSGERVFRMWYCSASQWATDFNVHAQDVKSSAGAANNADAEDKGDEVFIVPADEHFVRCPISKEVFETVWDEEEGEYMYRNAVKILVTARADPSLYALGRPCDSQPDVHYLIVHKLLVLDGWLREGRADTLKNAKLRYSQMLGTFKGSDKCQLLTSAADEEDEEDVFVVLELV